MIRLILVTNAIEFWGGGRGEQWGGGGGGGGDTQVKPHTFGTYWVLLGIFHKIRFLK